MAKTITVTTKTLTSKANELKSKNSEFKKQVAALREQQKSLDSMWDGDANKEFNTAFNNDATQMDNFYNLVERYVTSLNEIIKAYEDAEKTNVNTATTRKY